MLYTNCSVWDSYYEYHSLIKNIIRSKFHWCRLFVVVVVVLIEADFAANFQELISLKGERNTPREHETKSEGGFWHVKAATATATVLVFHLYSLSLKWHNLNGIIIWLCFPFDSISFSLRCWIMKWNEQTTEQIDTQARQKYFYPCIYIHLQTVFSQSVCVRVWCAKIHTNIRSIAHNQRKKPS